MKIDLHVHTSEVSKCGHMSAAETVGRYKDAGYDCIVITNHFNSYTADLFAQAGKPDFFEHYRSSYLLTEPLSPQEEHDLLIHEYGHTVQSLILGPVWSIVIGLPSMLWCNLPVFQRLRRKKGVPYSRLYCEGWANRLGQKVLKEKQFRDV